MEAVESISLPVAVGLVALAVSILLAWCYLPTALFERLRDAFDAAYKRSNPLTAVMLGLALHGVGAVADVVADDLLSHDAYVHRVLETVPAIGLDSEDDVRFNVLFKHRNGHWQLTQLGASIFRGTAIAELPPLRHAEPGSDEARMFDEAIGDPLRVVNIAMDSNAEQSRRDDARRALENLVGDLYYRSKNSVVAESSPQATMLERSYARKSALRSVYLIFALALLSNFAWCAWRVCGRIAGMEPIDRVLAKRLFLVTFGLLLLTLGASAAYTSVAYRYAREVFGYHRTNVENRIQAQAPTEPVSSSRTSTRHGDSQACRFQSGGEPLVVAGRIVTDSGIERGALEFDTDGRISGVYDMSHVPTGRAILDCGDSLIAPGFVNPHEHIEFSYAGPAWHPVSADHRHDWRISQRTQVDVNPCKGTRAASVLSEIRHLVSGTTTIAGGDGSSGIVRNADEDHLDDFDSSSRGSLPVLETFPLGDRDGTPSDLSCSAYARLNEFMGELRSTGGSMVAHIGEGTGPDASREFDCIVSGDDSFSPSRRMSVVHGLALDDDDFGKLKTWGGYLVWSPRSNFSLYGSTLDPSRLASLRVRVALGTDWSASGSSTMRAEAECALSQFPSRHDAAQQVFRMMTSSAAEALGLENDVGSLRVGHLADFQIVRFDSSSSHDEYLALIQDDPASVEAVFVGGVLSYVSTALASELPSRWSSHCTTSFTTNDHESHVLCGPAAVDLDALHRENAIDVDGSDRVECSTRRSLGDFGWSERMYFRWSHEPASVACESGDIFPP